MTRAGADQRFSGRNGGVFLVGAALIGLLGCAAKPVAVPVEGSLTLDGKALPFAILTFFPDGATGAPTSALSEAEGAFRLTGGMLPGVYRVAVAVDPATQAGPAPDLSDPEAVKAYRKKMAQSTVFRNPVPARYASKDSTPLRLTVPVEQAPVRLELKTQE